MTGAGATQKKTRSHKLAQAAEWRMLGLLLERPRDGWFQEVARLAAEVKNPELRRAAASALRHATEGDYLALIGPGGGVSPREVSYLPFEDPGHLLAKISGFYSAFAYQPNAEDPIDHLAVEVGFVAYLFLKEAFARADGQVAAARTTADARCRFLDDHLASAAAGFANRLAVAGPSYLLEVAELLAARVPGKTAPAVAPEALEDLCSGCGALGE